MNYYARPDVHKPLHQRSMDLREYEHHRSRVRLGRYVKTSTTEAGVPGNVKLGRSSPTRSVLPVAKTIEIVNNKVENEILPRVTQFFVSTEGKAA